MKTVIQAIFDVVVFSILVAAAILAATQSKADEQMRCLALNIYHEARSETAEGQLAVAHTTLNRVKSSKFPNTICKVVKQAQYKNGKLVKHKCAYSWFCDGVSDLPKERKAWETSVYIAQVAINWYNNGEDFSHGALFYHAVYVQPYWAKTFQKTTQIGNHIFYYGW